MASSSTVIAALIYQGGVVIAADSQASDPVALVRWPVEKLERIQGHPLVIGFSGSVGMASRARENLEAERLHQNMFKKPHLIRDALDRCLDPVYSRIKETTLDQRNHRHLWDVTVWGLAAYWAADGPHILELEPNGDRSFHDHFHAIGSGCNTAYAIWRTLGGRELAAVNEAKSIQVMLRIMKTCVNVEMWGVNEPFSLWVVSERGARALKADEIEAQLEYVSQWEEKERRVFLHG